MCTRLGAGQAGPWQARPVPGRAHLAVQNRWGLWFGWHWRPVLHKFSAQKVPGSSAEPTSEGGREPGARAHECTWRQGCMATPWAAAGPAALPSGAGQVRPDASSQGAGMPPGGPGPVAQASPSSVQRASSPRRRAGRCCLPLSGPAAAPPCWAPACWTGTRETPLCPGPWPMSLR